MLDHRQMFPFSSEPETEYAALAVEVHLRSGKVEVDIV